MKLKNLTTAIAEAQRFIERAEKLRDLHAYDQEHVQPHYQHLNDYVTGHPREAGAAQRASMDLTRALSTLRQDR